MTLSMRRVCVCFITVQRDQRRRRRGESWWKQKKEPKTWEWLYIWWTIKKCKCPPSVIASACHFLRHITTRVVLCLYHSTKSSVTKCPSTSGITTDIIFSRMMTTREREMINKKGYLVNSPSERFPLKSKERPRVGMCVCIFWYISWLSTTVSKQWTLFSGSGEEREKKRLLEQESTLNYCLSMQKWESLFISDAAHSISERVMMVVVVWGWPWESPPTRVLWSLKCSSRSSRGTWSQPGEMKMKDDVTSGEKISLSLF